MSEPNEPNEPTADETMDEVSIPSGELSAEDFERLALRDGEDIGVEARPLLLKVPVRKPGKSSFVRVAAGSQWWDTKHYILQDSEELDGAYWVHPTLRNAVEPPPSEMRLLLTVDRGGTAFLWPHRYDLGGNDWNESAWNVALAARETWVRMYADQEAGLYKSLEAVDQGVAPQFPEEGYGEILQIAFRRRMVTEFDHPVLQKLRGEL